MPVLRLGSMGEDVGELQRALASRGYEVACRIHSGTVWVNKHLDLPADIPFSGAKQSGLGTEMGIEGLQEFTQATVINVAK